MSTGAAEDTEVEVMVVVMAMSVTMAVDVDVDMAMVVDEVVVEGSMVKTYMNLASGT